MVKGSLCEVQYIDHMGSDLRVVDAARVSFNKKSALEGGELKLQDRRLITYLADHFHWTPFSHCMMTFRVKAPIFVARQLVKHQIGLAWNEESRRYVDYPPEFYFPPRWRKKATNKKQGSAEGEYVEIIDESPIGILVADVCENVIQLYNKLIEHDVAPEQARMILPQNMMTQWYWTGSLAAWARVCNLRLKPDAQQETREIAEQFVPHLLEHFPHSSETLLPNAFLAEYKISQLATDEEKARATELLEQKISMKEC